MHTQACESHVNHSDIISSNSTCFQYRVCPLTPVESRDQLASFHPTKQFLDTQTRNKKRAFSRWRTQLLSKTDRKEQYNDKMNVSGFTIMPVRDVNGKRDKGQCDLPGLQMCLGFISGTPLRPTGLKHPKATCFRGIVHINTQGSGSPQMVIRCDRYQARGLTLFKGQGTSVRECVCVSQRMTVLVMWCQRESQLFFLFFIRQKLSTDYRVQMIDFHPIVPSAFQVSGEWGGIKPLVTSGSITICESNHHGLFCPCLFDDLLKIDEESGPGSEQIPPCPATMTVRTCLPSSGWYLSVSFFPPSLWWKMVRKMKSEAWYLNINFLDGHASSTGYRSPLLFFWGLIYDRQICLAAWRFCGNTSSVTVFSLRISVPAFQKLLVAWLFSYILLWPCH